MWWLAVAPTITTVVTSSLLLRRFNSTKSCRALIHQTSSSFFTTFNSSSSSSSSKFGGGGGGGTFILHHQQQQANNNLHTITSSSSSSSSTSKFGTIILQTNEPSSVDLDEYGEEIKKDIIKMFMLSSVCGSGDHDTAEEEDKDDDDQKKKKTGFKLDEDLGGFSAIYKDFNLQHSIRMVGSCNGIICLHDPMDISRRDVYLWNPATRQFKILPKSILMQDKHRSSYKGGGLKDFVGFGFDVKNHDYKVLRITPFTPHSYGGTCRCGVQVYSLSTDSWRVLDGIDDSLPLSPTHGQFGGTYLKGRCFFLGSKPINHYGVCDLMLWSFDFTKEIFTIIELPDKERTMHKLALKYRNGEESDVFKVDYLHYRSGTQKVTSRPCFDIRDDLSYMGDQLAAFKTQHIDFAGGYVFTTPQIDLKGGYWYYDMWALLSEHHCSSRVVTYRPGSWTKLHEFRIKTKSKHPYTEPICVSKDGEFALISTTSTTDDNGRRKKLMLFDLVTKEEAIEDFTISDQRFHNFDCRAAYVYKESQVSIMGGGGGNALLRWQLPTHGTTYKLNLDAPFIHDHYHTFGIGLCLTSDTGGCIGVRSVNRKAGDAKEGEAMAMFEAIKWAIKLELSPIIIEYDSKNMVSFFMEDDDDTNLLTYWNSEDAQSILKDAKSLFKSSENSISFQYCSRSCNYVAEIASKLGSYRRMSWYCKDWTANSPGEVVMSLSKDLGLETSRASEN